VRASGCSINLRQEEQTGTPQTLPLPACKLLFIIDNWREWFTATEAAARASTANKYLLSARASHLPPHHSTLNNIGSLTLIRHQPYKGSLILLFHLFSTPATDVAEFAECQFVICWPEAVNRSAYNPNILLTLFYHFPTRRWNHPQTQKTSHLHWDLKLNLILLPPFTNRHAQQQQQRRLQAVSLSINIRIKQS
jgi:hypothetical protein